MKWKKVFPDFKKAELLAIDEKFLSMLGFWPENVINFRSLFFVLSCLSLEIIPGLCFIIKNLHDIRKVFTCLHEFISFNLLLINILILVVNRDKMFNLISNLRKEWKNCKLCHELFVRPFNCNFHLKKLSTSKTNTGTCHLTSKND